MSKSHDANRSHIVHDAGTFQCSAFVEALFSLPEHERIIIALHLLEGLTCSQIASIQRTDADAIESCCMQARKRLTDLLCR